MLYTLAPLRMCMLWVFRQCRLYKQVKMKRAVEIPLLRSKLS